MTPDFRWRRNNHRGRRQQQQQRPSKGSTAALLGPFPSLILHLLLLLLLLLLLIHPCSSETAAAPPAGTTTTTTTTTSPIESQMSELIKWFRSRGGTFNSKLAIGHLDPNDPSSRIGMYATSDIKPKEVLLEFPDATLFAPTPEDVPSHYLEPGETMSDVEWDCIVVYKLINELQNNNGDDDSSSSSFYAPYVDYLSTQKYGQLPAAWSRAGRNALVSLLSDDGGKQSIPPGEPFARRSEWSRDCGGNPTPFEENAYLMMIQRGWDHVLIPVYDMMSHRNGNWTNTESNKLTDEGDLRVRASRGIKKGEEIYMTYNFCADCGARLEDYGTPEILRDYGFVEQYPRRFVFHHRDIAFDVDEEMGADDGEVRLVVTWYDGVPEEGDEEKEAVIFLEDQLERLHDVTFDDDDDAEDVPPHELETIETYQKALIDALSAAIDSLTKSFDDADKVCTEPGVCTIRTNTSPDRRYSALAWEEDELPYADPTCDMEKIFEFKTYEHDFEVVDSPYHKLQYFHDETNKDTCFEIDAIVQMCGCYRAHYHEMVVHFTARYLKEVKRVVWVGGGDSMLLHEILKYESSLELVVGLELDQKVTRHSFKHFGTSPHWDNPKVQWWYGDATKSLLMLPKEYFGTFDMVLVDLSETVMSLTVTDHLDVFGALSLLLKDEGILVKNEHYLDDLSAIFDYTIQLHFDCPIICHQCLILGSHKIDFLHQERTNHDVPYLLDKLQPEKYHDIVHDYKYNKTSSQVHCSENDLDEAKERIKALTGMMDKGQEKSPGILMVIDAEDIPAAVDLGDVGALTTVFSGVLTNERFTVISTYSSSTSEAVSPPGDTPDTTGATSSDEIKNNSIIVMILGQGYVVARTFPDHHYCAFDIHLWSSFDKHEDVKRVLVNAVGAASYSSYRIVAGGMFDVDTWKEDELNRGPRVTKKCDQNDISSSSSSFEDDENLYGIILDESISNLLQYDERNGDTAAPVTMVVLCKELENDKEEEEQCRSIQQLKHNKHVKTILPLWACPDMDDGENMVTCENEVIKKLTTFVESTTTDDNTSNKIQAIVIDPEAPITMGQILHKIFKRQKRREALLDKDKMLITTMMTSSNDETEEWKRNLIERFRKIIKYEPIFRSEIAIDKKTTIIGDDDGSIEVGILSVGDKLFFEHLKNTKRAIEERHLASSKNYPGYYLEVRYIRGGLWKFVDDYTPDQFFLTKDYDQTTPLSQYMSQRPLGLQSLFQLEVDQTTDGKNKNVPLSAEFIHHALENTLSQIQTMYHSTSSFELRQSHNVGSGTITTGLFSDIGNVVVLWDGQNHVDINLFTYDENGSLAKSFQTIFRELLTPHSKLNVVLHDEQPRGCGKVVNFKRDLEKEGEVRKIPHWA